MLSLTWKQQRTTSDFKASGKLKTVDTVRTNSKRHLLDSFIWQSTAGKVD